jgi:TPR repeat protein
VAIYERLASSEDPGTSQSGYANALYNLTAILVGRGQYNEALAAARKMVPVWGHHTKTAFARFAPGFLNIGPLLGFINLEMDQPRAAADTLTGTLMLGRTEGLRLGIGNNVLYQAARLLRSAYRKAPQVVAEAWQVTGQQLPPWILDHDGDLSEVDWYRQAAADGYAGAISRLACLLEEQGQMADAETWWRKAAEADDVGAMVRLADCLRRRGELDQAEPWWRKAAKAGDTTAMNNLSLLLLMRQELAEAEEVAATAALYGNVVAMNTLGVALLQQGRPDEAETWFRKAAGLGYTSAAQNLRAIVQARHEHGEDALRKVKGIQWYQG